jgi:hypothetical protein
MDSNDSLNIRFELLSGGFMRIIVAGGGFFQG